MTRLEQIRPPRFGQRARLSLTPTGDLAMIAGQQNFGNFTALEDAWLGVMRIFKQAVLEAFFRTRFFLAHDAGQQAHNRIEQYQRRGLAAREHVIANGDLFQIARFDQPLVDTLKAPANDRGARPSGQVADARLRQRFSAWAHEQPWAVIIRRQRRIEACGEHIGAHHHAGATTGRRVIDIAMFAEPMRADVDRFKLPDARASTRRRPTTDPAIPETSQERA